MVILIRAITYASVFVGFMLVFLPMRVLQWAGVGRPALFGAAQAVGAVFVAIGAALALWCILTFALVGRGTPAPFDPPRRLVVRGPYRFVRNPMYIGASLALGGAALFYQSIALLAYTIGFLLVAHLFVRFYEEPRLRRDFGAEYEFYAGRVRRWWPGLLRSTPQLSRPNGQR